MKTSEKTTYKVICMDTNDFYMGENPEYLQSVDRLDYIRSINPGQRFRLIKITRITLEEFTQDQIIKLTSKLV